MYICKDCGYQFRNTKMIDTAELWHGYQEGKQTIAELAEAYNVSPSTIKRKLSGIKREWVQPPLSGSGYVHLDVTYWGRNWGILLALDEETGRPLYVAFVEHEKVQDYVEAVRSVEARGYKIKGIVIDGMRSLFEEFSAYRIQMCQFHMQQIVNRYLTKHPRMHATRELSLLIRGITKMQKAEFEEKYQAWKDRWKDTLNRRTMLKSGKTQFTHKKLRSAMHSIDFYLPYLFTYQMDECEGMPNTNNKIEGTFTDLKKNLNNHSGLSVVNRKRFISGFFLAWDEI